MLKGVIYARYSSDKQNEQSIAGQIDVCTKWAKNNDVEVIQTYHDEALTGRTDKRPSFQRMISDAKTGKFDYIIVYKLDRFARNRYDSAIYKAQLKKYNVRIMSAMENIAEGPEGIILESVLEGMAEYYSANLSQNVIRGLRQKAEQGKYLGGRVPLGYKINNNKEYEIDEYTAPAVERIFKMYADGYTLKEICKELNETGYKTNTGKKFTYNSLNCILKNDRYIGKYNYLDISIDNAVPRIIDDTTFLKVQERLKKNKHAPASSKSPVMFYLTGKLFCGKCGNNMVGDSGTSCTGSTYFYYSCIEKKLRHGCKKKSVRKEVIEDIITKVTINQVLTNENIEKLSQAAYELYQKSAHDDSELIALKSELRETQKTIDNLVNAIEQGIITSTTKERLLDSEERKESLLVAIAREEIAKPIVTKEHIKFYLNDIRNKVYNSDEQIEIICNTFVNAIYLYDDKLIITFNFRDGESLKKIEISELEKFEFICERSTITILSELFMFAIIVKLHES